MPLAKHGPPLDIFQGWPEGVVRPPESLPANRKKENLIPLPDDWYWEKDRRWTCPIHDSPEFKERCYECGHDHGEACPQCEGAKWVSYGPWRLKKKNWMEELLKRLYKPVVERILNDSSIIDLKLLK